MLIGKTIYLCYVIYYCIMCFSSAIIMHKLNQPSSEINEKWLEEFQVWSMWGNLMLFTLLLLIGVPCLVIGI